MRSQILVLTWETCFLTSSIRRFGNIGLPEVRVQTLKVALLGRSEGVVEHWLSRTGAHTFSFGIVSVERIRAIDDANPGAIIAIEGRIGRTSGYAPPR